MHRFKRFAWMWAAAGVIASAGMLGACDPEDEETPTKPDAGTTVDSGTPDSGSPVDSGTPDSGTPDSGTPDSGTPDAGEPDSGTPDAGPVSLFPLAVDEHWAAAGYMGDGEDGLIQDSNQCAATRPGAGLGNCHHFTWTPGGKGWGGVWWQFPEGNWGEVAGYEVPEGATSLSFYAWGTVGDEKVTFMVGMGTTADGFALEMKDVPLTLEPKQYTIDVSRVRYRKVVGGFGWVTGGRTTPLVFFVDDVQWH